MADRSVVYRLMADVKGFQAGLAQASASTKKLAGDLTAADKAAATKRQSLTKLGSVAGKVGLVAAAGLGAAVLKAADFDQAMSNVQAATHETAGNMEQLREAALQAGADTAFSATEAAAGIENLAKAGVSTQEILGGGLMGALDLAAAGEMGVAEAAEAAAGAMAQFKLEGEDVPHIADLLAAGAGKAQGDVSDMVMALKQGGTVAAQTGLTIEETTGALAAMAEQSLLGSDAGTSFKTMLMSLTPNSEKAANAMELYNIHAFDAQGNFVGMTELAGQLRSGLQDLSQQERATALETIFGSDAVRAATIIYDNGAKGIQKWIDKTDDQGYAAETASIKLDNLKGDLEALGGSLETALIGTGDGAQGPLRSLVQGLTSVVNAYNRLPSSAQNATAAVLGGAALLGGSVWAGTKIINGIASTRLAMENLGISAERSARMTRAMGLAMKGLAVGGGIVAGLMVVTAAAEKIRAAFDEALPGINQFTGSLLDLTSGAGASIPDEFDSIGDSIDRLTDKRWDVGAADSIWGAIGVEPDSLHDATREVDALDAALANIASTAGTDVAASALNDFAKAQGLSADQLSRLKTVLPQYDEAVAGAKNSAKSAALETAGLAGSSRKAANAMGSLANMSAEEAKALQEAHDAAAETGRAFFGLGNKVNDAKVSLGGWLRSLEKQRAALRDFRIHAQTAAKKGLDEGLIQSLQEAGPEGALRMRQLANASKGEIGRANQVWRAGQREIDRYANAIAGVPKDTKLNIKVDSNASTIAAQTAQILNNLDDEIVYIHAVRKGPGGQGAGYDGFADGGFTGWGGAREPAGVVHGREFVFSEPATRGNEAYLEQLHRNLRGYATGGYVEPLHAAAPRMSVSTSRTVERVVERMPNTVVLNAPGLGRIVATVADQRIDADRTYRTRMDDRD